MSSPNPDPNPNPLTLTLTPTPTPTPTPTRTRTRTRCDPVASGLHPGLRRWSIGQRLCNLQGHDEDTPLRAGQGFGAEATSDSAARRELLAQVHPAASRHRLSDSPRSPPSHPRNPRPLPPPGRSMTSYHIWQVHDFWRDAQKYFLPADKCIGDELMDLRPLLMWA